MAEAREDQPTPVSLDVEAQLAATTKPQTHGADSVRFEGVAVTPGTYVAEDGVEIEITADGLPAIATKLEGVQIRDLHEERVEATVGAVREARVEDEAVVFEGGVGIQPHAQIVRCFPETVAFSVGFRFSRDDLELIDGTAPLPEEFIIDHLALVGQGQDPQARLTRLLNRAHPGTPFETDDETDETDTTGDGTTVDEDTLDELRRQRDEALEAKDQAKADLAEARSRLETKDETIEELELQLEQKGQALEQVEQEREAAKLELEQARTHFADSILKLKLRAGREVDLTERREELLGMDLGELDELRLELADEAAEAGDDPDGPVSKPTGGRAGSSNDDGEGVELDLGELDTRDTIRLGLMREAI